MLCLATPLFRRGRKLPADRHPAITKGGRFRLTEVFDSDSRRTVRVARVLPISAPDRDVDKDELLPLWDAEVIYARGAFWSVTGIEREVIDGVEVSLRQTWALRELPAEVCEEIESSHASGQLTGIPITMWGMTGVPSTPPAPIDPRECSGPRMERAPRQADRKTP
ncbi:hypothetical protein [Roseateles noduli]|uniref:hypothetical protein n=1 Tax=Roseateles noduli TaxID=2052484 RepID=UPI003D65D294